MSNERRRRVLYILVEHRDEMALDDLATRLAAWPATEADPDVPESEYRSAYVSLYQTHLPELDDAGVVAYDSDASTVHLTETPQAQQVVRLLGYDADHAWSRAYLLVCAAAAAAGLAAVVGVPNGLSLAWVAVGAVLCVGLSLVAVLQRSRRYRIPDDGTFPELSGSER